MKLTVIIVNYNVKYFVEQCLDSLNRALEGIESEIYVVDNHSKDNSVKYLRERFKDITIIDSNHNLGFGRANNIVIKQTNSEYVLFINPDTFVGEEVVKRSLDFLDSHPDAGAVGVKMINSNGTKAMESRRGLPTPMTAFYKMCGLCSLFPKNKRFAKYYMSYLDWDNPHQIDIISGAYMMVRRSTLDKVGFFDENFFMYGEDVDLSYRILKEGFKNWYLPETIMHYKGESTKKTSFKYVHVFYQAMLIFFRKHYNHLTFLITLPIKTAIYARASVALVKMLLDKTRHALGLYNKSRVLPRYIFVGDKQMLDNCLAISRRKGLTADFQELNNENIESEFLKLIKCEQKIPTYVVFDTNTFSYQTILEVMSSNDMNNVQIGTYNNKTGIIITQSEIIK